MFVGEEEIGQIDSNPFLQSRRTGFEEDEISEFSEPGRVQSFKEDEEQEKSL